MHLSEADQVLLLLLQVPLALLDEFLHRRRGRRDRRRGSIVIGAGTSVTSLPGGLQSTANHKNTQTQIYNSYCVPRQTSVCVSRSDGWGRTVTLLKETWLSFEWTFPEQSYSDQKNMQEITHAGLFPSDFPCLERIAWKTREYRNIKLRKAWGYDILNWLQITEGKRSQVKNPKKNCLLEASLGWKWNLSLNQDLYRILAFANKINQK